MNKAVKVSSKSGLVLKWSRVVIGVASIALVALVFLDIHNDIPISIKKIGLYFQFVPSAVQSLGSGWGWAESGCVLAFILTFSTGRLYCSILCPLGVSMDVAGAVQLRPAKRNRYQYSSGHPAVRLMFLVLAILPLFAGNLALVNLLDPYSTFGRLASTLARPLIIIGNNAGSFLLESMGSYALLPVPFKGVPVAMLVYSVLLSVLLVWLARKRGRFYCNTVCPVGTLLGYLSKLSFSRVRLDKAACIECGRCEQVCKSECIDFHNGKVDVTRCVDCFNCLTVCPVEALSFGPLRNGSAPMAQKQSKSRRRFFVSMAATFTLFPSLVRAKSKIKITVPSKIKLPERAHPILPPGSERLEYFVKRCTSCHACVAACPSQVLQPDFLGYGTDGMFMPAVNPDVAFCNLNCNACGAICPTDALKPFTLEEKKTMQLGVVRFVRENCIVLLQGTACGACSEHCPTKAVTMVDEGGKMVPQVKPEICLGCGACEHVCPAKPHKAIYVEPHDTIKTAEKPDAGKEQVNETSQGLEEFPF